MKKKLTTVVAGLSLGLMAGQVFAVDEVDSGEPDDVKYMPATTCQSASSAGLFKKDGSISNKSTGASVEIICPVIGDKAFSNTAGTYDGLFAVDLFVYKAPGSGSLTCQVTGRDYTGATQTATASVSGSGNKVVSLGPVPPFDHYTVGCTLPKQVTSNASTRSILFGYYIAEE